METQIWDYTQKLTPEIAAVIYSQLIKADEQKNYEWKNGIQEIINIFDLEDESVYVSCIMTAYKFFIKEYKEYLKDADVNELSTKKLQSVIRDFIIDFRGKNEISLSDIPSLNTVLDTTEAKEITLPKSLSLTLKKVEEPIFPRLRPNEEEVTKTGVKPPPKGVGI